MSPKAYSQNPLPAYIHERRGAKSPPRVTPVTPHKTTAVYRFLRRCRSRVYGAEGYQMPVVELPNRTRSLRPLVVPAVAPTRRSAAEVVRPARISFGGTAAIVTSMALITGLAAANASKGSVISALLIAAVADNLTDSLSVHVYQESEGLEQRDAFVGTLSNFLTRLVLCLTFAGMVTAIGVRSAALWGVVWGMALLSALTFVVARRRRVSPALEIAKHLGVAIGVILASRTIGEWIAARVL